MKYLLAASLAIATTFAHATPYWSDDGDAATTLAKFERYLGEQLDRLYIQSHHDLNALACRIGAGSLRVEDLIRTSGLGRVRTLNAIQKLMDMKLISPGGPGSVAPYDRDSERKLRDWSDDSRCGGEGACGAK